MADKIRVELEVDPQKGLVVLRDFDRQMEQAVSGAGQSGRAANQAGREFDEMGRKVEGAGRRSESAGALFKKMAGMLGIAFSVQTVAAWAGKVDEAHASHQKNLNMVSTMLDRSSLGQEKYNRLLQQYGTGLDDLSVKFGESTGTLSKGLYDILSASVAPGKAMQLLKVSAEAARAGFTDTASSVNLITNALNAYGLDVSYAAQISDVAFATVAKGKTTFAELAASIGRVAPQAAQAGISFEQLSGMLANVTRQGLSLGESVTAINQLILQFSKGSDQAQKAWAAMTKNTEQAGTQFGVARLIGDELFRTLNTLSRATDQQRTALLQEGSAILAANILMKGSNSLRQDLAATSNAAGQTQEALGKRMGESDLIAKQFDQTIERLWKNLGTRLAPAVDQARSNLTELFSVLNRALEKDSFGDFLTRLATGFSVPLDLGDAQKQLARAQKQLAELSAMPSWLPSWFTTDSNQAKALRAQISTLQEYIRTAKEAAQAVKSLGSGPLFPGDDTIQGALAIIGTDSTKADMEALAKLEKTLADEMAKATLDSFDRRERALNEWVAAYVKAGGDIKKVEGDITTLRAANDRARVDASNSYWLKIGAAAEKAANEDEARDKRRADNARAAELAMAQYTGDSLKIRALEHEKFVNDWIAKGATRDKAEELWAAKRVQADKDAALLMAQYTGDSLAQQALEHEQFVNEWIARGLKRERAEELWAAKTNQSVGTLLKQMSRKWLDYNLIATESFKTALDSIQGGLHDFIYGAFTGELENMGDVLQAALKSMANIAANILSQIGTGLIAKGLGSVLEGLFDKAVSGAVGAAGGGVLDWLAGMGASAAGALGFKSLAAWLGGSAAPTAATVATSATVPPSIALQGVLGKEAAASLTQFTAGGSTGGTASTGSLAAMFATPAGAMIAGVLPGMVGAIFHDQINSLLGEGGAMTAEEAIGNWAGAKGHLEGTAEVIGRIGSALSLVGDSEGYFSQAAVDAYRDFERLRTVAGYTQAQLDAVKASLDPVSRGLLESGRIALGVEDDIRALAKAIARGREEFDWSKETIDGYQAQIDALAAKYGLTGEAAGEFSRKIWNLSEKVNASGAVMVEAGDAVREVADGVVDSLRLMAGETDGIAALAGATNDLLGNLVGVASAGRAAADSVSNVGSSKGGGGGGNSNTVGIKHVGGAGRPIYYRHDGWPSLGPREYMAILEEPEWVIRSQAVNPQTEPMLSYINRFASLPQAEATAPAAAPQIVYLTVVTPDGRKLLEEVYEDQAHGGGPPPRRLEVRL